MATDALTSSVPSPDADVFYPDSDGKPMGETQIHQEAIIELIVGLKDWFAADPRVYVGGDMFLYYVPGDPKSTVCPDVMVALDVPKIVRRTYKTWEEGGKGPDLVIEVSSRSTRREELRHKFAIYRDDLRVREYFLFDPLQEYLKPPLRGFRLVGDDYEPIPLEDGRLPSEVLGLDLMRVGELVRFVDPTTGQVVLNRLEALAKAHKSSRRQASQLRNVKRTVREQAALLADRELTIREREITIQEQQLSIGQRDLALGHAELERAKLQDEIERLTRKPQPD